MQLPVLDARGVTTPRQYQHRAKLSRDCLYPMTKTPSRLNVKETLYRPREAVRKPLPEAGRGHGLKMPDLLFWHRAMAEKSYKAMKPPEGAEIGRPTPDSKQTCLIDSL
jgi:hypothetical protein